MTITILGWILFFILLGFVMSAFLKTMRTYARLIVLGIILFVILHLLHINIFPWWI